MIWQFDLLLFVLLVVTAIAAVRARRMIATVAILSAYSLFAALVFAGAGALDVAFVEVVLGSAFVGILFLVVIAATGDEPTERSRSGRLVAVPVVGAFVVLMVLASSDLPDRGDPDAPAHRGAAARYVEGSEEETDTPNVVTAVLADYRSVDTLGETLVVFTAALAVVVVLRREPGAVTGAGGTVAGREPSEVVRVVGAVVGPFVTMFGIYVIAHGHYGPGGGFAGGVVVAVAAVLTRVTFRPARSATAFPPGAALPAMGIGMGLFLLAGFAPVLGGGAFLDYAASPVAAATEARTRYLGIFVVEVGVGLVVAGALVALYDRLAGTGPADDPTDRAGDDATARRTEPGEAGR